MRQHGTISSALLAGLLGHEDCMVGCEVLTALMLKYRLLVAWEPRYASGFKYLRPALFPMDTDVGNESGNFKYHVVYCVLLV
jgi:hypothetical protein